MKVLKPSFLAVVALGAVLIVSGCNRSGSVSGLRLEKEQGTEENIASLTQVVERNPRNAEAYNVRGSAYGRSGQYKQALEDFNTAIKLNPRYFQAYSNRALMYKNTGDFKRAIRDYNRALAITENIA